MASYAAVSVVAARQQADTEKPVVKEEVPFDRPVAEIAKFIAPMNELTLYPCTFCHDPSSQKPNPQRRVLTSPHDQIPAAFANHDTESVWCLDCHTDNNMDRFHLLNGKLVEFNEYYLICEQCHKKIYRGWKMGAHGKRTGMWNGDKQWMHCAQCHDPHDPPVRKTQPMPAPQTPLAARLPAAAPPPAPGTKAPQ